jgi:hypothetical protein
MDHDSIHTEHDRQRQIDWLERRVADLSHFEHSDLSDPQGTVDWWIDSMKNTEQLPAWFDSHDRDLMIEWLKQ